MQVETMLAGNIRAAGDKVTLDSSCKRILANKNILAWIMKSCLREYQDYDINDIVENYIEGNPDISQISVNPDQEYTNLKESGESVIGCNSEDSTINEGTVKYDIRFYAVAPSSRQKVRLIIDLEAQKDFYPGYPLIKRGIYYCSRMISSQYGTVFSNCQYGKIRKVYSIWICMAPPKKWRNSITQYAIHEKHIIGNICEKKKNYDLLTVVMIGLGNPEDGNYSGVLKLLGTLFSPRYTADEKMKILQEEFQIMMTKSLESEVYTMCNFSEGFIEQGIQLGIERGIEQGIEQGIERGIERGIEQGIEQGIERGIEQGLRQGILSSIKNLMETMKFSEDQAMKALKVPEADQSIYAVMLKQRAI